MTYRRFFDLVLLRIDAARAHSLAEALLRTLRVIPFLSWAMRRSLSSRDPAIEVAALGLTFSSPLGVAAGIDKNATLFEALVDLGFGFVEVGTITAQPQSGNPGVTMRRLPRDRALHNRMGFPNVGAKRTAERLSRRSGDTIVGANIGKTRAVSVEAAAADYLSSVRMVAAHADYLVLNVSSPNTPGLRAMQGVERLRPLVASVQSELRSLEIELPLLVKIAPDLGNSEVDEIADLAVELNLDGIVAVNTTTDPSVLQHPDESVASLGEGGISGPPLAPRAIEILRRLYARVGDRLVLVSVGGIENADDAWERILAGATLLQAHTGFIYGGPLWPHRFNKELARKVRAAGAPSLGSLVGKGQMAPTSSANGDGPAASGEERIALPADAGQTSRGAFA